MSARRYAKAAVTRKPVVRNTPTGYFIADPSTRPAKCCLCALPWRKSARLGRPTVPTGLPQNGERAVRVVKVVDREGPPLWQLCRRVERLCPDTAETIAHGAEIEQPAVWRPSRLAIAGGLAAHRNPLLRGNFRRSEGRNHQPAAVRTLNRPKADPTAVGRKTPLIEVAFAVLQQFDLLAGREVEQPEDAAGFALSAAEDTIPVRGPVLHESAIVTHVLRHAGARRRNDICRP